MKKFLFILASIIVIGAAGWRLWHTTIIQTWLDDRTKQHLPPAEQPASIGQLNINSVANYNTNTDLGLATQKNLAVPFTVQAPHANWDQDHGEFCEEASVLMAGRYFSGRTIGSPDEAETALQSLKTWELDNLGFYYDTTAEETAQMAEGMYDVEVELVEDPTINHIKLALTNGSLVIAPFDGRDLHNPNYRGEGPVYHMLVIRGYTTDGKFITNDPGTRKGEQYVYEQSVIMQALHDWIPGRNRTEPRSGTAVDGPKVILVVSPKS